MEGYYAFGGLNVNSYTIRAIDNDYSFCPWDSIVQIPQPEIQPYDFTATASIIGSWRRLNPSLLMYFSNDGSVRTVENGHSSFWLYSLDIDEIQGVDYVYFTDNKMASNKYRYSINGNTLHLELVDSSYPQGEDGPYFNGDWTKQ